MLFRTIPFLLGFGFIMMTAAGDPILKDITKFSDLAADFNQNSNKVRIVTLLSPT